MSQAPQPEAAALLARIAELEQTVERLERAEAASAAEKANYAAFIANSSEGIWRFDLSEPVPIDLDEVEQIDRFYRTAYLADASEVFMRMYGFDGVDELRGVRLGDILPRTSEANVEYLRAFIRSGYRLLDAESHEHDREGNDKVFLNNLMGEVREGALQRVWGTQRDITEQRRQLAEIEAVYAAAPVGLFFIGRDRRFVRVNETLAAINRKPVSEHLGRTLEEVVGEGARVVDPYIDAVLAGGEPVLRRDVSVPAQDGRPELHYLVSYHPVRNQDGIILGVSGVVQDITERRRAADALSRSESRYRALFEQSPISLATFGVDGRPRQINTAWAKTWGVTLDHMVAENYNILADPQFAANGVAAMVRRAFTAEPVQYAEVPYIPERGGRAGTEVWVGAKTFPLVNDAGTIDEVVVVHDDVTERRRAQAAVEDSERRLRVALEAGSVAVWEWNLITGEITWSDQLYRFHGREPGTAALSLDEYMKLVHPDDVPQLREAVGAAISRQEDYRAEYRIRADDTTLRWLTTHGRALRDESGRTVRLIGATIDITERKHWEEALLNRTEELARSNADLQQFAYTTSHDLQEPLRAVSSYSQLLGRKYRGKIDAEADEFIHYIVSGVDRMNSLIRDLLLYSRVVNADELPPARVSLATAIETALSNLHDAITSSGAEIRVENGLPEVKGDPIHMGQLFQNLIGNAIKYRSDEPPRVRISAEQRDSEWLITVRDNGVGIAPAYHESIFGVFKRLHGREIPGTGIGLAICRRIVERHGGRIWVESQPGHGAAFRFTLQP